MGWQFCWNWPHDEHVDVAVGSAKPGQALVPAGHPEAHTQAYFEGQEIPEEHALKVLPAVRNKMVTETPRKERFTPSPVVQDEKE